MLGKIYGKSVNCRLKIVNSESHSSNAFKAHRDTKDYINHINWLERDQYIWLGHFTQLVNLDNLMYMINYFIHMTWVHAHKLFTQVWCQCQFIQDLFCLS